MPIPSPASPDAPSVTVPLDGMVEIPNGTIVAIVTFLESRTRPDVPPDPAIVLDPIRPAEPDRFRALFRDVGNDWLWTSRLRHSDADLSARIGTPGIATQAIRLDGVDVGVVETDARQDGSVEVVLFGLAPRAVGRGLGKAAFARVVRDAFDMPGVERVWLHTCTLDHPRALGFYRGFGFRAFRRAIEIVPDPRLSGLMPADAAPDHPICAP